MTDSRPDADSPTSKPRGLWSLMGRADSLDEPPPTEPAVAEVEDAPVEEVAAATSSTEEPPPETTGMGRRGLWELMKQAEVEPPPVEPSEAEPPESPTVNAAPNAAETKSPAPRGLFSLMQRSEIEPTHQEEVSIDELVGDREAASSDTASDGDNGVLSQAPLTLAFSPEDGGEGTGEEDDFVEAESLMESVPTQVIDPDDLEPPRYRKALAEAQRQSWIAFACGAGAMVASALAMLPYAWIGFPASLLGFAALIVGYLTLTGTARREMSSAAKALTMAGMVLGALGVFLGPLFFAGLGRDLRESSGRRSTEQNLAQLGVALNKHHDQNSSFPIGGVFSRDGTGAIKGQHGWMTFLLPFVGEGGLYQSIQQDKSYDDPVNRPAMGHDVETYFAAGGNRSKISREYAVSHFAGVGGEINNASGLSHLGVFERDTAVKKDEVTDGLSNTLVVGELPGDYPPWGDPENWRPIGRGLNQNLNGFGSAAGNGATFLFADGTVRFFNNQTDPKLLERLSTRDGDDDR